MATQKTKEELVRLSWLTELRRQGHRQCHGVQMGSWETGRDDDNTVCAMRLLAEMHARPWRDLQEVGTWAALNESQVDAVIYLNDGHRFGRTNGRRHTFAEIADVVERWFQ